MRRSAVSILAILLGLSLLAGPTAPVAAQVASDAKHPVATGRAGAAATVDA